MTANWLDLKNTHDSGGSDREHSDKIVRLKVILKQLKTIVLALRSRVEVIKDEVQETIQGVTER